MITADIGLKVQNSLKTAGFDPGPIDGDIGPKSYKAMIEYVAGGKRDASVRLARAMSGDFPKYGIDDNFSRICHFLGQACCETMYYRRFTEMGGPDYFQKYEGRQDLGNTQPGDGLKYYGRGIFDITGRWNYRSYSTCIGIDLINFPERAAEPEIAVLLACMFWNDRSLNSYADHNDVPGITHRINGGSNGLAQREQFTDTLLKLAA